MYTEIDKVGSGISIKDAYPISDSQGKMLSGTNEVFDFKITSNTATTSSIPYEITARKKIGSTLDESAVKLYLTKVVGDSEEEVLLDKYSELPQTSRVTEDKYIEKTIYTGKVPANSTNYEQAFKLRMWIDSDVNFSQLEDGSYPYNDKEFTVTVNVYANAKVVTEEDKLLEQNNEISSVKAENAIAVIPYSDEYDYEIGLPSGTTETSLNIETESPDTEVKVEKIDKNVERPDAYTITVGYNTREIVTNFQIENNENYALLFDYQNEINPKKYVRRLNKQGQWEDEYCPIMTSNNTTGQSTISDENWWNLITQYPINASITILGLLRPISPYLAIIKS